MYISLSGYIQGFITIHYQIEKQSTFNILAQSSARMFKNDGTVCLRKRYSHIHHV